MKFRIDVEGDSSIGERPVTELVELNFLGIGAYDIEFYNEIEEKFLELLSEYYGEPTPCSIKKIED